MSGLGVLVDDTAGQVKAFGTSGNDLWFQTDALGLLIILEGCLVIIIELIKLFFIFSISYVNKHIWTES